MTGAIALMRGVGIAALILTGSAALTGPSHAQSDLQCGSFYRIKAGDTLRAVTLRAYRHDRFLELYDANRDVLTDPARIEVGQLLFLPCAGTGPQSRTAALSSNGRTPTAQDQGGTLQSQRTEAQDTRPNRLAQVVSLPKPGSRGRRSEIVRPSVIAEETQAEVEVAAVVQTPTQTNSRQRPRQTSGLLLLSARGLEPLAAPDLPSGGLIGELIEQSYRINDPARGVEAAFVNDRQAHLDVLLPLGSFAMGYPWPAPDCEGTQGPHTREFCAEYEVSLPIFQIEMRVLARFDADLAGIRSWSGLGQKTVCRPAAFPPVDLERLRITKIMLGEDLESCLVALRSGQVDLVSAPVPMIDQSLYGDDIVEVASLESPEPVHAIFSRKLAETPERVRSLNAGLRKLQSSGEWFRIVSGYLSDYNSGRLARSN